MAVRIARLSRGRHTSGDHVTTAGQQGKISSSRSLTARTWLWFAVGAVVAAIAVLSGLAVCAQVFHWQDFWKSAGQPYATVLTGLAALSAAALALHNGERQRAAEHLRWAADQQHQTAEADRLHDREVTRELRTRFTTATEQLADNSATIRRAGAHALAALADDWHAKGSTSEFVVCLDVLTGYLKAPNDQYDSEAHTAGPDGAVRATIVAIIHHRAQTADHWRGRVSSIEGADLRGVDFSRTSLSGANMRRTDLRFADLMMCNLTHADLADADLSNAQISGADLRGARLEHTNFQAAKMHSVLLAGSELVGVDFTNADLTMANLAGIRAYAKFADSKLFATILSNAQLHGSNFVRVDVEGADVAGADLSGVVFGSMNVGDFRNLHLAALSDRQKVKYADAIQKSRERSDSAHRFRAEIEDPGSA